MLTSKKFSRSFFCRACHEKEHERVLDFGEGVPDTSPSFEDQLQPSTASSPEIGDPKITVAVIEKEPAHEPVVIARETQSLAEKSGSPALQITKLRKMEMASGGNKKAHEPKFVGFLDNSW
jgi:hypothetical protein